MFAADELKDPQALASIASMLATKSSKAYSVCPQVIKIIQFINSKLKSALKSDDKENINLLQFTDSNPGMLSNKISTLISYLDIHFKEL